LIRTSEEAENMKSLHKLCMWTASCATPKKETSDAEQKRQVLDRQVLAAIQQAS